MKNEKAVTIICSIGMAGFLIFMMDSGDGQWWLPFIIITVLLFIFGVIPIWINDYKNTKKHYKRQKK